jgi:hypothetical protein
VEWFGKTYSIYVINVGFLCVKAPVTAAVLRDMRELEMSVAVGLLTSLTF